MRAAPAVAVEVRLDAASRLALTILAGVSLTVAALWAGQRRDELGWVVLALVAVMLAASLWSLLRAPSRHLSWDGQLWRLALTGGPSDAAMVGRVSVALDLGHWMLLRFHPDSRKVSRPVGPWLPLRRQGLEPQWHALRCAVHGPRPRAATDAGAPDA